MEKMKIPNEEKAKALLIKLIRDIHNDISDDPRILASMAALLIGAIVSTETISGEDIVSGIVGHLIENGLLNPVELTQEEVLAMHKMPAKNQLN